MSMSLRGARVLVTGLRSFTGHYLEAALQAQGAQVFGTVTPGESLAASADSTARVFVADLMDPAALQRAVQASQPTHVVHLAAISFVAHDDVDAIYRTNVVGTRHLLTALAAHAAPTLQHVVLASSANIYGNADVDPIAIDTPPRPANDYAVSKLAMEHMAWLWRDRLPLTIVRPFNYTGLGQSARFLVPKIVAAYRDRAASLELGNLEVERDFSDVRDVVHAYVGLLGTHAMGDSPKPSAGPRVVNVCSGRSTRLQDVLSMAETISGHRPHVVVNPQFVRHDEVKRLRGDPSNLHAALASQGGWSPRPLQDTISWMLQSPS